MKVHLRSRVEIHVAKTPVPFTRLSRMRRFLASVQRPNMGSPARLTMQLICPSSRNESRCSRGSHSISSASRAARRTKGLTRKPCRVNSLFIALPMSPLEPVSPTVPTCFFSKKAYLFHGAVMTELWKDDDTYGIGVSSKKTYFLNTV